MILYELLKAFLLALPAVHVACEFAPILRVPPLQKLDEKLTLQG
jgi:hypothetical protein